MQVLPNAPLVWHSNGIDPITGLPGPSELLEKLTSIPHGADIALLCIGIDYVTALDKSTDLAASNSVLAETAKRIATHASDNHYAARFGFDEFAVLIEDFSDFEQVTGLQPT